MTRCNLIVFIVVLLLIIGVVGSIVGCYVGLEQAFTAALTSALVYVTAVYAFFTFQIVETSNKQARIMNEQQLNSAAPVIMLEVRQNQTPKELEVNLGWINVGKGPALNFRCWIEDPEHYEFRVQRRSICRTAVEVARGDATHHRKIIHTEISDYKLGVGYIRAQYESIFGQTYESCLFFPENTAPELKYGKAVETVKF